MNPLTWLSDAFESLLHLHRPLWLLLLPLLVAAVGFSVYRRRRTVTVYSDVSLLRDLPLTWAQRLKSALPVLKLAGLSLLVVALARPRVPHSEIRVRAEGIAIEMCIDRSGSMRALDFQWDEQRVNRLAAVKRVFREFVEGTDRLPGRPNDAIGLIAFGGFVDAECPLTLDHDALVEVLGSIEIPRPILDSQGRTINKDLWEEELATAIGDAVLQGVDRLRDSRAKSKVLILLSDGEQTAGIAAPAVAAEAARRAGVKIYSIGVGSTGQAPFPQFDRHGRPVLDAYGKQYLEPRHVVLDEETLRMMADSTGGRYFSARSTGALSGVYAEIDLLEKTFTEGKVYREYAERYLGFLVAGAVLLLFELILTTTWLRSLP